jgi:phenylpyruvate tautomerase PptA (4-oxalocrotonate tautomerase family)
MPFYEVFHCCPLSISQQDELAEAITNIHANKFSALKNFVNVAFKDIAEAPRYIAGKRQPTNQIFAYVRTGPTRTQDDWNDLIRQLEKAWYDIAGTPLPQAKGRPEPHTSLRGVIVLGGLVAAMEAGFLIPSAGGDAHWVKENYNAFKAKADAGEQEFVDLIKDAQDRGLLEDGDAAERRAQKQLEEMLGWGDAA